MTDTYSRSGFNTEDDGARAQILSMESSWKRGTNGKPPVGRRPLMSWIGADDWFLSKLNAIKHGWEAGFAELN